LILRPLACVPCTTVTGDGMRLWLPAGSRIAPPANEKQNVTWLQCNCCEAARVSTTAQGSGIPGHFNDTHRQHDTTHTPKRRYTLPCVSTGASKHANGLDNWIVCTECNDKPLRGLSLNDFKQHLQAEYKHVGPGRRHMLNRCYQPACKDFPSTWKLALEIDGPASKWSQDDDEEGEEN
jgi:hypothetical protein